MADSRGYRDDPVTLRLTWDDEVDMGYLYLTDIGSGEAVSQRAVENPVPGLGEVVLDFDRDGRLVGIEFFGRALLPPGLDGPPGQA